MFMLTYYVYVKLTKRYVNVKKILVLLPKLIYGTTPEHYE